MMMVLGLYVFMLRTVPYQELQYQRSWRHAANSRVNRRPSTQFLGPDNDMLTLSGVLMPEITGGRLSLLALEQMAEQGKAWPLIEGSGTIYGMYVIEGLNQTKTEFFRDGMPRRIEFTLSLKRVDESLSDMFGDLSAQLNNLQDTATSALSDISNAPFGKSGCPFHPSASVMTAPRRGSTIFPSASSSSRSSWSASNPRLSVSVRLIRRLSSTVVISLPSILMLNAGVLLPLLSSSELKFTTAALPPFSRWTRLNTLAHRTA